MAMAMTGTGVMESSGGNWGETAAAEFGSPSSEGTAAGGGSEQVEIAAGGGSAR